MTHTSNTTKGLISFAVISSFIFFGLYILSFASIKLSHFEHVSALNIAWVVFAFIAGILSIGGRGLFPIASTVLDNNKNKNKRLLVLSLSILFTLVSLGFVFGFMGHKVDMRFGNIDTISEYIYISLGIIIYIISLAGLGFIKIEKIRLPNIFNKKGNLWNIFSLGFVSNFTDIFPVTILLLGVAFGYASSFFGGLLFLAYALGRISSIYSADIIGRFNIDSVQLLSKCRSSINIYSHVVSIIAATLSVYLGFIFYFERAGVATGTLSTDFVFNGWLLVVLWLVPLWVFFFKEQNRIYRSPVREFSSISHKLKELEIECSDLNNVYKFNERGVRERVSVLKRKLSDLAYESKIIESSIRHSAKYPVRNIVVQNREEEGLQARLILNVVVTLAVITLLSLFVS